MAVAFRAVDDVTDEDTSEPAPVKRQRRFPLAIWLVVALQAMLMIGMTVLYPSFQSPDEVAHVDYVIAHRQGEWFDGSGERRFQAGVQAAYGQVPGTQFRQHAGGVTPLPRSARKSFDTLGAGQGNLFPNQMTQHPPLYYGLAAAFTYVVPNWIHQRFDLQVFWLRLFSLLLLLPVPLLIYSTAWRICDNDSLALTAALIPLSMPLYLRTGASVTNDSLMILLGTVIVALLVKIAWGNLSRRTAVLLGLAWGAALLTKGFALSVPPAIGLAYLVGATGTFGQRVRQAWPGVTIAGAVGSAIGAWWWVRNVIVYGTVQPDGFSTLSDNDRQAVFGTDHLGGSDLNFPGNFFRLLGQRIWGSIGLIDQPSLDHWILFTMAIILAALLVLSLLVTHRRFATRRALVGVRSWTLGRASTLIVPALLMLVTMYYASRRIYLHGRQLSVIQVRYLLPAIIGLVICVAVAVHVLAGRAARWLPLATLTGTLVFVGASVYSVLDVEMSSNSPDRLQRLKDALHYVAGWAPFPAPVTALLLAAAGGVAVATLVVLAVMGAHTEPVAPPPAPRVLVGSESD
ncbi:MAG: hypothetical protein DLM58_17515 [Pseudonocardiales bacterium]|nr:MAG: hypothetical protein DLM58_17515 [Pseudonocardiales bacterium]